MADLRNYVRSSLRIKTKAYDADELEPLIMSAKGALRRAGVKNVSESDPAIQTAIMFYCKAHFGYNDTPEKYEKAFNDLADSIALNGGETSCEVVQT